MEFCRRSTNSNGRINRKATEFLPAAKIGKCGRQDTGIRTVDSVKATTNLWGERWSNLCTLPRTDNRAYRRPIPY
jgi:hypothetical protein